MHIYIHILNKMPIVQNFPKRQDDPLHLTPRSCRVKLLRLKLLRVTVAWCVEQVKGQVGCAGLWLSLPGIF